MRRSRRGGLIACCGDTEGFWDRLGQGDGDDDADADADVDASLRYKNPNTNFLVSDLYRAYLIVPHLSPSGTAEYAYDVTATRNSFT